jgi:predicted nuclease with RNAse H fold
MSKFVGIDLNGYGRPVQVAVSETDVQAIVIHQCCKHTRRAQDFEAMDNEIIEKMTDADVIAIDAPLGFPMKFRDVLLGMDNSYAINHDDDFWSELPAKPFRRHTESFLHEYLEIQPLSAVADKLAYVAIRAIHIVRRFKVQHPNAAVIPFDDLNSDGSLIIEVYPSATLIAHDKTESYKGDSRENLIQYFNWTKEHLLNGMEVFLQKRNMDKVALDDEIITHDHLDALICLHLAITFRDRPRPAKYNADKLHALPYTYEGLIYY